MTVAAGTAQPPTACVSTTVLGLTCTLTHTTGYVPTPSLSFEPLDGPFTEAQTVSVKCVGKEVEPPSSLSLDLVKDNSSTSLGYSEDGYLHVPLSDYILPHFHGALVRCTAASGGEAASGAVAEVVLNITCESARCSLVGHCLRYLFSSC